MKLMSLIAPDESYMVFISFERPDGYGGGDLYISFREDDSTWTEARNLGEAINSEGLDYCPSISPDGTIFFFTTIEMEKGDVFGWIPGSLTSSENNSESVTQYVESINFDMTGSYRAYSE